MGKSWTLTKRPTLLTAILSVATLAGYAAYRLTLGSSGPDPAEEAAMIAQMIGMEEHDHAGTAALTLDGLPDVVLNDLNGAPATLNEFSGRPLVINFWATWCPPCLREIPLLKEFHAADNGIEVVGIAVERPDPVHRYAEDMQFNYPVLVGLAEGMDIMGAFENIAGAMPFSVFVAPDGTVLGKHAGELHAEHLQFLTGLFAALAAGDIDVGTAQAQIAETI